ncbi:mask [Symbiodinium pilosum]|uniref:Mask protein n=1 Tax=Symbiodinium pilosum TaxID=2952 RepID=A0A812WY47_SYMPI|nr:mask [Symbiodinium pilosum]
MIHVWTVSGQELPAISLEDVRDVRDLKSTLRRLHGFPICMQQLLHNGNSLEDSTQLGPSSDMSMQLVLSAPSSAKQPREAANELLEACEMGSLLVTRLLLEAGAHKDEQDTTGYTALMCAASHGHEEIVQLLLEAGADKDARAQLSCMQQAMAPRCQ